MSNIDIKLKSYDELQFEVTTLITNMSLKDLRIKELQERIDKAIEYIESDNYWHSQVESEKRLLEILRGSNNDK